MFTVVHHIVALPSNNYWPARHQLVMYLVVLLRISINFCSIVSATTPVLGKVTCAPILCGKSVPAAKFYPNSVRTTVSHVYPTDSARYITRLCWPRQAKFYLCLKFWGVNKERDKTGQANPSPCPLSPVTAMSVRIQQTVNPG